VQQNSRNRWRPQQNSPIAFGYLYISVTAQQYCSLHGIIVLIGQPHFFFDVTQPNAVTADA